MFARDGLLSQGLADSLGYDECEAVAAMARPARTYSPGTSPRRLGSKADLDVHLLNSLRREVQQDLDRISDRVDKLETSYRDMSSRLDSTSQREELDVRSRGVAEDAAKAKAAAEASMNDLQASVENLARENEEQPIAGSSPQVLYEEVARNFAVHSPAASSQSLEGHVLVEREFEVRQEHLSVRMEELSFEVAKLRADFEPRCEEVANECEFAIRNRTEQLETRMEELWQHNADAAGCLLRLEALERRLALQPKEPSLSSIESKITEQRKLPRVSEDSLDLGKIRRLHRDRSDGLISTATEESPATNLLLDLLKDRLDSVDGMLKNGQSQHTPTGEIEDLRQMINETFSNVDALTTSFRQEREAILETFIREIDSQFRGALSAQVSSTCASFRTELQEEIIARIGAAERDAIASVRDSFGAGVQTALSELHNQFKKLQAAQLEAANMVPRITNMEHELRGTTRLVTSLAKKALDDHENKFATSAPSDADGAPAVSGFASVAKKGHVGGDFEDAIVGDATPSGMSTAAASSDISPMRGHKSRPQYGHEGIEESHTCDGDQLAQEDELAQTTLMLEDELSQLSHGHVEPPASEGVEGLFANLQGLATSLDKTIGLWTPPAGRRSAPTHCLDRSIRSLQQRRTMSPVRSPPTTEPPRFSRATVGSPSAASRQLPSLGSPSHQARNSPPMPADNSPPRVMHGVERHAGFDVISQRTSIPVDGGSLKVYVSPRSSIDLSSSQKSAPGTPQQAARAIPVTGLQLPAHAVQRQASALEANAPSSPQHVHRQISAPIPIVARLEPASPVQLHVANFDAPPKQAVRITPTPLAASPGGLSTSFRNVLLPAGLHQGVSGVSHFSPRQISRTF